MSLSLLYPVSTHTCGSIFPSLLVPILQLEHWCLSGNAGKSWRRAPVGAQPAAHPGGNVSFPICTGGSPCQTLGQSHVQGLLWHRESHGHSCFMIYLWCVFHAHKHNPPSLAKEGSWTMRAAWLWTGHPSKSPYVHHTPGRSSSLGAPVS